MALTRQKVFKRGKHGAQRRSLALNERAKNKHKRDYISWKKMAGDEREATFKRLPEIRFGNRGVVTKHSKTN